MTSIHTNNLVYNKRYYRNTKNIVNAIFMGSYNEKQHLYFSEFKCYNRKIKHGIFVLYIDNNFKYYDYNDYNDVEEIREKSKRARQQMEQRSLNMILKRLVNEDFQW